MRSGSLLLTGALPYRNPRSMLPAPGGAGRCSAPSFSASPSSQSTGVELLPNLEENPTMLCTSFSKFLDILSCRGLSRVKAMRTG